MVVRARTALLVVLAAAVSAALLPADTGLAVDDGAIAVSHQPLEENLVAGDALPTEAAAASPQCPADIARRRG